MDVLLDVLDTFVLDRLYAGILPVQGGAIKPSQPYNANVGRYLELAPSPWASLSRWPRDFIGRQYVSFLMITWCVVPIIKKDAFELQSIDHFNDRVFGLFLYFLSATLSYYFVYDHRAMQHPKFLRNQIPLEIKQALRAMPLMSALTAPFFVLEVRGFTKLYDFPSEAPFTLYNYIQYPLFIAFTDFGIYWIHRGLHYPMIYKRFHKPHHKWIISTPFASYAFHPLDGWAQSVPYHIFPVFFPLQKAAYLGLFTFVTIWTVMIHDGEYATNSPVINGSACHTIHHYYFNYNYGQFTTFWDRVGGSYRKPNIELFDRQQRHEKNEVDKQVKEMNQLVQEVEGEDDRCYGNDKKDL